MSDSIKILHGKEFEKDITSLVANIKWSGDWQQAARTLTFNLAVSPHDHYLPKVHLAMGDMITLTRNDRELFRGYIFSKEKSIGESQMNVTVYDGLIYLMKSKATYKFKGLPPDLITRQVCQDFLTDTGHIEQGSPISWIFEGVEPYKIIMTAYTLEAGRSGKAYMIRTIEGRLEVVEKGSKRAAYVLDPRSSITNAKYSESMEESINKVHIYDEEGSYIDTVELDPADGVVGILQDVYVKEKDADAQRRAKALLKGIAKTADIEALGDVSCITGNGVIIREPYTGLQGLFYIDSDEHTWENGQHHMSLKLAYQNIMDEQTSGEDLDEWEKKKQESNKTESSSGSAGSGQVAQAVGISDKVLKYQPTIEKYAKEFGVSEYVQLILALTMQESGGRYKDVMQASECGYNTRYSRSPNSITDPDYSIWCGVQEFRDAIQKAGVKSPTDMNNIKLALQGYNFGPAWIPWAKENGGYSKANAQKFSNIWAAKLGWKRYGDVNYIDNVLKYYSVTEEASKESTSTGASGKRQAFIKAAESFAGWKYSRDYRMSSWAVDCSSLVGRAMVKAGLTTKAFVTTASMVSDNRFEKINKSQIKAGDILWEKGHVGVFLGNNKLIEAANSKQGVVYSKLGNRFTCGYRIRGIDS